MARWRSKAALGGKASAYFIHSLVQRYVFGDFVSFEVFLKKMGVNGSLKPSASFTASSSIRKVVYLGIQFLIQPLGLVKNVQMGFESSVNHQHTQSAPVAANKHIPPAWICIVCRMYSKHVIVHAKQPKIPFFDYPKTPRET